MSIQKTLQSKKALTSYIRASKNKHIRSIAESMNISVEELKGWLEYHDLLDAVILFNAPEKELGELLTGFRKDRKVLRPYEIDFYLDGLRLGVDFNGTYWHSSEFRTPYYHQEKALMALSNGVKLYQIFEYEWSKKDIVLAGIQRLAGVLPRLSVKEVREIDRNAAITFLHFNTLSYEDFDLAIGCFSDDLCAIMTFKGNVLTNYAEIYNKTVLDGFKRAFDYFRSKYTLDKITAFNDLAKPLYEFSGFSPDGVTEPELVWFKNTVLTPEKKAFLLRGSKLSEEETLKKLEYKKLYTSGKVRLISD